MFPMTMTMTMTIHTPAQLDAVLKALRIHHGEEMAPAAPPTKSEAERICAQTAEQSVTAMESPEAPKPAAAPAAPGPATALAGGAPEKTASAASPAAESAEAEPQASTAATGDTALKPVTYDQVAKAITDKVKTNRAHAVAVLSQFGAKRGTDLKPEQFAAFLEALQ